MLPLSLIGEQIRTRRKTLGLSQAALAQEARVARSTLEGLENARLGELGFVKITHILAALGLELKLQESGSRRPTLEEMLSEDPDDQGMG